MEPDEVRKLLHEEGFGELIIDIKEAKQGKFTQFVLVNENKDIRNDILPNIITRIPIHPYARMNHANVNYLCAGTIVGPNDTMYVLSVAHVFNQLDNSGLPITLHCFGNDVALECKANWMDIVAKSDVAITSDISFFTIRPFPGNSCITIDNCFEFRLQNNPYTVRQYRLQIDKENRTEIGKFVWIIDQNGKLIEGKIKYSIGKFITIHRRYENCIAITDLSGTQHIGREGDSGALVVTIDEIENNVFYVLGFVIGLYEDENCTIVTRLWDVLRTILNNQKLRDKLNWNIYNNDGFADENSVIQ